MQGRLESPFYYLFLFRVYHLYLYFMVSLTSHGQCLSRISAPRDWIILNLVPQTCCSVGNQNLCSKLPTVPWTCSAWTVPLLIIPGVNICQLIVLLSLLCILYHQLLRPLWYQSLMLTHSYLLLRHHTQPVSLWKKFTLQHTQYYYILLSPLPANIIEDLNHQLDARWRHFGNFLRVKSEIMDNIEADHRGKSEDCMLNLLERWTSIHEGTGDLPRTWQTIVDVIRKMGLPKFAKSVALKNGVNQTRWQRVESVTITYTTAVVMSCGMLASLITVDRELRT